MYLVCDINVNTLTPSVKCKITLNTVVAQLSCDAKIPLLYKKLFHIPTYNINHNHQKRSYQ